MIKVIKFILKHRKDLLLLLKDMRKIRDSVHRANMDKKIDRAELLDILREADDVFERIIDIVEE